MGRWQGAKETCPCEHRLPCADPSAQQCRAKKGAYPCRVALSHGTHGLPRDSTHAVPRHTPPQGKPKKSFLCLPEVLSDMQGHLPGFWLSWLCTVIADVTEFRDPWAFISLFRAPRNPSELFSLFQHSIISLSISEFSLHCLQTDIV